MIIFAKNLIGLRTETKSGQYLGRVRDFEIDADDLEIKKIHVRPVGIIKGFAAGDLLIGRSSIVSVDDKKITVLDLVGEELVREKPAERKIAMESSVVSAAEN